jgi:hypothetical protein
VVPLPALGATNVSITDERERIAALEDRVLVLEACLLEIEKRLKIRRKPNAVPKKLPPPEPVPSRKPQRSGSPVGEVRRSNTAS